MMWGGGDASRPLRGKKETWPYGRKWRVVIGVTIEENEEPLSTRKKIGRRPARRSQREFERKNHNHWGNLQAKKGESGEGSSGIPKKWGGPQTRDWGGREGFQNKMMKKREGSPQPLVYLENNGGRRRGEKKREGEGNQRTYNQKGFRDGLGKERKQAPGKSKGRLEGGGRKFFFVFWGGFLWGGGGVFFVLGGKRAGGVGNVRGPRRKSVQDFLRERKKK